jgi:NAD(P)H-dependent FMN reductase
MPAILKNAIDWTTRTEQGTAGSRIVYGGKKFAIMSASPGKQGGARSLAHLRSVIDDAHGTVIEREVVVPKAHEVFSDAEALERVRADLRAEMEELLR